MKIKITNHTRDNEVVVRYVANNGKYQINMETLGENKMSEAGKIETTPSQRKGMPVFSGVLTYFPDALKEVAKCSLAGQKQHNQGDKLYWDKNKSFDNEDALVRHLIDHSKNPVDDDGILHLAKVAWRALASLQIYLENR